MNKLLEQKRDFVKANMQVLPTAALDNYAETFAVDYTHNSTAIEGNTLTLRETALLLHDKLSVGGKDLREIYEVINHNKAFDYVNKRIEEDKPLDENAIKDIHGILMDNIMVGGIYRTVDVYISGAQHVPPTPNEMFNQIKAFYADLENKNMEPVELAAWTHAEFVKIHPYVDGNGRTSRLIMNYQLMSGGYLPVSIPKEQRFDYYDCLEEYAVKGNSQPFVEMIAQLEEQRLDWYVKAIEDTKAANNV